MASSTEVCAVCDLQHQTTISTHRCIECEEPLCASCKEYHNVLKATRNHKTISISDYQLLPSVVTDTKQHCINHNEIYQLYCIKHECPICNKCVKDHGKCGEILSLDEKVKDIKTSESFVDLEQSLDDLLANINQIHKDRESNIEIIKDQKNKIAEQVCHIKKKVIHHVNKLEEEFMKELDQIVFNCCNPIRSIISSLQDQAKKINQIKSEIQGTQKYASDLQAFLSIREVQVKTNEFEKHLQSCIENKSYDRISIGSAINAKIQDILRVDKLCSIEVKKSRSTDINLNGSQDRQAQMMIPKELVSINNVKLVFKRKVRQTYSFLTGCCVTKKCEYLFSNYEYRNQQFIVINADGAVDYNIPFNEPYGAYDVACFGDSTVAISTGYSHTKPGISIVDLIKRKTKTFVDLPGSPFAITYDGKSLICCLQDEDLDLHVISCTNYIITKIPNTLVPWNGCLSTHADKIFYTNPDKHTVTCCLYSGVLVWEFKDPDLEYPRGLAVDNNNGNVFVAGNNSCNIVVISPDGKRCKQILTKKDGRNKPTSICFDKVRNQLLVQNNAQFANVYNISYV
ncbi:E3 ubiquitin-protein ligase TRIM71-like [Mytilus edulis]|uniref:E3 ubiquitin-protein ligase TRIM71-like n=1 Tax=Mytilus edulis TaxID=6550 RepID=UPI0039EE3AD2